MQLPLGPDPRTDILRRTQAVMIARFGRIVRPHEKKRDPVWALVQGVVGAQTKTVISNANTDNLLARYGSWEAVAAAPLGELTEVLRSATFAALSAERLKACLEAIVAERGAVDLRHLSNLPDEAAMAWLEALPGVGRKNAAGVLNTSVFERRVLVIDGHHRRVMQRMGLVPPKADTASCYNELMPVLPAEWTAQDLDEHHLLAKRVGQVFCRPSRMDCTNCPLREDCQTGREAA